MKAARPYPIVTITPKGERAIVDGHPWVYEGEVVSVSGTPEDGSLVDVVSKKGSWLGCGFYNSASKIRVRLVTRNANDDPAGDAFWERRLRYAWDYRKTVMGEADSRCCRIIFGEADGFPGLTVDRFERVLVAQGSAWVWNASRNGCCRCWYASCGRTGRSSGACTNATTRPFGRWRAWRRARAG